MDQNAEDLRRFVGHLLAQYGVPVTLITQDMAHMGAALAVYRAVQAQGSLTSPAAT